MRINPTSSLLLVVDIQSALLPAIDGGEAVLGHTGWLIDVAQTIGIPVLATEHCPQRIGVTDARLRDKFRPEAIVEKEHFSAVSEGALLRAPDAERGQWIVTGTVAHVCVQQTVLDLLAGGDLAASRRALAGLPAGQVVHALFSAICREDPVVRWHAITCLGDAVGRIAADDLEAARIVMRRFLWSLNDESGGIGWGAPEAMAGAGSESLREA